MVWCLNCVEILLMLIKNYWFCLIIFDLVVEVLWNEVWLFNIVWVFLLFLIFYFEDENYFFLELVVLNINICV